MKEVPSVGIEPADVGRVRCSSIAFKLAAHGQSQDEPRSLTLVLGDRLRSCLTRILTLFRSCETLLLSDFAGPSADALIGRRPTIRENGVSLMGSLALLWEHAVEVAS